MNRHLTAIIEREGNGYVSFCPEVDVASQGNTVQEASANLREAVELFLETASPEEISSRLHEEVYITRLKAATADQFDLWADRVLDAASLTDVYGTH